MEVSERKALMRETGIITGKKTMKSVMFLSWISVIGSLVTVVIVLLWSTNNVKEANSKMVVIDGNGNSVIGEVQNVNSHELAKIRAENALKIGVEYMYSFTASNYDNRIEQAKSYWGKAKNEILMSYKNQKVRETVIQNNLVVDIVITKIDIGYSDTKLLGRIEFEQSFVNGSAVKKRKVIAECEFQESQPTNENSTGYVIDKWIIVNQ